MTTPAGAAVFAHVAVRHGVELIRESAADRSGARGAYLRLPFTLPARRPAGPVARLGGVWSAFGCGPSSG